MSHRCEHGLDSDVCSLCYREHTQLNEREEMNTTTQAKHTPGPWQITEHESDELEAGGLFILSEARHTIAEVFAVKSTLSKEGKANARLIASAPALLEALQACADKLERVSASARGDNGHSEHTLTVLQQARAAIQAATLNQ